MARTRARRWYAVVRAVRKAAAHNRIRSFPRERKITIFLNFWATRMGGLRIAPNPAPGVENLPPDSQPTGVRVENLAPNSQRTG
eukprot:86244-Pyramimonas_sp.AAC.1